MSEQPIVCTVCQGDELSTIIDLGLQPPANRFIAASQSKNIQDIYPLAFGFCQCCGTAQLTKRMPVDAVRPRFDWLLYNEPEGHLDDVAKDLTKLPGINDTSSILGITYKDQSTIDRLKKLGIPNGLCIDIADFHSAYPIFGLETIQQFLRKPALIQALKNKYGKADVVLMRHIVEHTDNAAELIDGLKPLINEGGYLVMELPDSEKIIQAGNHAFLWEEHISYFTEESLQILARRVGADIAWFKRCVYPYEDSLLAAFRFNKQLQNNISADFTRASQELNVFSDTFTRSQKEWRTKLSHLVDRGDKVAVFGAGHLAAKFINFFGLQDLIDCVIDDNAHKAGMMMPGSLVPIVPSSDMIKRGIKVCISTLSPESEAKVRQKLAIYFDKDVELISAFAITGKH